MLINNPQHPLPFPLGSSGARNARPLQAHPALDKTRFEKLDTLFLGFLSFALIVEALRVV
jgi:hypothetical protein